MDKQIAGVQANSVPGVFSVTNNLVVEEDEKEEITGSPRLAKSA